MSVKVKDVKTYRDWVNDLDAKFEKMSHKDLRLYTIYAIMALTEEISRTNLILGQLLPVQKKKVPSA